MVLMAARVNPTLSPSSSGHALPVRPSVLTRNEPENVKIDVKSGSAQTPDPLTSANEKFHHNKTDHDPIAELPMAFWVIAWE